MGLQIIIGGTGSGKSELLVSEMAKRSLEKAEDRFFAVVPEQATLNMQLNVVRHVPGGAAFNIDVVSFNRLAQVVFSDLGMDVSNVLDDTGKVLILRQVLEDVQEDLSVYRSKVHMPGFAQRIKSAVTELKQYAIDDNGLFLMQESAREKNNRLLYAKLEDLRLISRRFNERIRDAYRASEELLALFASRVRDSERLRGSHIYLDGFTGFTPVQYLLLTELIRYAADVSVTLTIPADRIKDPCPEYDLFHLSNQTLSKLSAAAAQAGREVRIVPADGGRTGNGADPEPEGGTSGAVKVRSAQRGTPKARIFSAADQKEEVTFAAKEILRLVKEEGLRFREIAVITSDMESYHEPVRHCFQEAGIPCFIDHKSGISANPLPRFILAALDLYEQRFSYDSVFTFLKTGLTDLSFGEICRIENYCLEFGLKGFKTWSGEMTKNRSLYGPEPKEDQSPDERFAGMAWDLDEINGIRRKVMDCVETFYQALKGGRKSTAALVRAIRNLLKKNRVEEKLEMKAEMLKDAGMLKEQREYEQTYGLVMELLEKTVALSGTEPVSVKDYRTLLESGFSEIRIGIIPPTIDTLTVGDLTRTRLENIKVLFFLGADDSRIPASSAPAGILSAKDREFLKDAHFEIAPTSAENVCSQRFYLYQIFNKPEQVLYISWPMAAADGQVHAPAYILEELPELVPGICVEEAAAPLEIRWKKQALKELAEEFRDGPDEDLLSFFAAEDPQLLSRIASAAFYTNAQTPLDRRVALDLYGDVLSGSVSRYEKFSECPFKQFLSYGLRLEKRPEYEIAAADVGTIYHAALERYSKKLEDSPFSFRDVPDAESRRIAEESVKEALDQMPSDIMDSSARNEFFVKRITDVTIKTTDILRAQVAAGSFDPDAYELSFTDSLHDSVRFKGKIDRVDLYDAEDLFIKIIDYKSGQKAFKIEDIYAGIQLQLVAYLKEAISVYEKEYPGRSVRPGGVYYYLINDRFVKNEEEAAERFRLSGLTSCEEGLPEAADRNLAEGGSSLIVNMKYKKDGTLAASSQAANDSEFQHLMQFVSGRIEEISSRIRGGEIEIHPYYEQERNNACSFCDYKNICRFEAGSFGCDWRKKDDLTKKEMEAEIYGRIQTE